MFTPHLLCATLQVRMENPSPQDPSGRLSPAPPGMYEKAFTSMESSGA